MRMCIQRGAKQIGGSCIELSQEGTRIVLDLGLPLDGDPTDHSLLPSITGDDLAAIIISHPHIDHYGLLHHLPAGTPVAMGEAAKCIVRTAAPFTGQELPDLDGPVLRDREPLDIGPFRITPFLTDHSAFDAYSLLIEAGGKRVFYSGDFRAHGRKAALFERMIAHPPKEIDVLLMEGSSLSRLDENTRFPTEVELEQAFVSSFQGKEGLVMVHTSAQNIDRMVTLFRAARKTGRTMIIDLYSAAILSATGHASIPKADWPDVALYVPESQRRQIKKHGWFDLLKEHSSNRIYKEDLASHATRSIILYRPLMMRDLEYANCLEGARFIYSQWRGYLEQGSYASTHEWLRRNGIDIEYLHTSGHASPVDLKRFAQALSPRSLVPIHTFEPEQYPNLFENVESHADGEWWHV